MKVHDYRNRRHERVVLEDTEIGSRIRVLLLNADEIAEGDQLRLNYGGEDQNYQVLLVERRAPDRCWVDAKFVGGA
jgi:hypothetical protein